MSLRATSVLRIGTLSTVLANSVLYASHVANLASPFSTLFLGGALFRCLTLPLSLYGDQCLSRAAGALPELREAHHQYMDIVNHPRAIHWEKRVAAQKLKNDRERIFRSHRTNNVKMFAPHMAALVTSWYTLGIPSQQIGEFFVEEAGMAIVSPLSVTLLRDAAGAYTVARTAELSAAASASATLTTLDPTLTLAATLTLVNVLQHLRRREGFNDGLDAYIADSRRLCWSAYAAIVLVGLAGPALASTAAGAVAFLPAYVAPVWLGMATTTLAKGVLLNGTAPGRALCRLPPYPAEHGSYGAECTAEAHEYRLAFTSVDAAEKREVWQSQKRALDYECDVRLHRLFSRSGLFDPVEEMEHEAGKLREKLRIARARAAQRRATGATAETATAEAETQTLSASERRRAGRQEARRRRESLAGAHVAESEVGRSPATSPAAAAEGAWTSTTAAAATMPSCSDSSSRSSTEVGAELWERAAGAVGGGGPDAATYAAHFHDVYSAEAAQRRVDRAAARGASYRQRSHVSAAESLLGTPEAAAAAEAAAVAADAANRAATASAPVREGSQVSGQIRTHMDVPGRV